MATEMATKARNQYLNYTFDGKEPWEEVQLVFHPHWATLVSRAFVLILVWVVIAVLFYFFKASWVTGWAMLAALVFTILYGALSLFLWYNTVGIITDYRVLQIRQRSLFNREVAATMWANVMSVNVSSQGALASVFGFGTIICDPGGSELTVDLFSVPDVYRVQQMALTLMRRAQEEGQEGATRAERFAQRQKEKKVTMD